MIRQVCDAVYAGSWGFSFPSVYVFPAIYIGDSHGTSTGEERTLWTCPPGSVHGHHPVSQSFIFLLAVFCICMGLLRRQDHISLCAPLSRGQRLVTPRRSSWGGGLGGDLESHWFNSADADQAPAVCPELCDVLGGGGGAEREGGKARSSVIPKVPRE